MQTKMSLTACAGVAVMALAACSGSSGDTADTSINPLGSATVFRTILPTTTTLSVSASVDPANPGAIPGELTYTIVSGDFPIKVYKQFGCESWEVIAAFNELDPASFPFPGTVLKIPPDCAGEPIVAETTETSAPSTATSATPATTGADGSATYEVQSGDTVSGIASNFDVTAQALAEANGWSDGINHLIIPGDVIIIPGPATSG
jgi:LysM repeat protein